MVTNNSWNSQDPAQVAKGGTGDSSFTAYAPVCGGTATTSPLQSAATGFETPGTVFTSNGNAALPFWQVKTIFSVDLSASIANATGDGTVFLIPFDIVNVNQGGAYNTTTHQFTAPAAGTYFFSGACGASNIGSANDSFLTLLLNGAEYSRLWEGLPTPGASGPWYFTGSIPIPLNAGDVVDLRVKFSGTSKTVSITGDSPGPLSSTFGGFLLG